MVFSSGRGRPPVGNEIVGDVDWDEELSSWSGSNGYYWHGIKLGGWKKEAPDPNETQEERKRKIEEAARKIVKLPRSRPPSGNEIVGEEISFNFEVNCYQTNLDYYWHGTFKGGWKKYPPGAEPEGGQDNETSVSGKKRKSTGEIRKNVKGRRPRPPSDGDAVEFDDELGKWVSGSGLVWFGTYNGGWQMPGEGGTTVPAARDQVDDDGDEDENPQVVTVEATVISNKKGSKTKGRKPKPPSGGGRVEYNSESECWECPERNLVWYGSANGGWKENVAAGKEQDDDDAAEDEQENEEGTESES